MTYNDLCEEVKELGFETSIDSPTRMLSAARRALKTIYTEYPSYKTVVIYQMAPRPIRHVSELTHRGGEDHVLTYSSARAFSFKSTGAGALVIREDGKERTFNFSGPYSITRGFLYGSGELAFVGEYTYAIADLAIFDEILSERSEDIPLVNTPREYDIKSLVDGFISFAGPPSDSLGNAISGASLCGDTLVVPASYSGNVYVTCKRGAELGEVGEIDLPTGCEPLLALLTAAYYWLDDDADKAQYYHSLYREGMSSLRYYGRNRLEPTYNAGNGWA